jgi:hypothetical protein
VEKDYACSCGSFTIANTRVNDAIVGNAIANQMALTPIFANPITLSLQLSLALTFIAGKLASILVSIFYLPSILGYLLAGIGLQDVINSNVLKGCGNTLCSLTTRPPL